MLTIEDHRKPNEWKGYVTILVEDTETGEVWVHGQNTITLDARKIMAALLGPKREVVIDGEPKKIPDIDYLITEVHWGSGSSAPARDQKYLDAFVIATEIAYPVAFDETSVTFQSSINPGQGPENQNYGEVALVAPKALRDDGGEGRMFARYAFPTLTKFPRLRLSVRWQIFFA